MSDPLNLSPHFAVSDAAAAIDFYKAAFGAVETARHLAPNSGKIMHASLKIANRDLMLNDDFSAEMGQKSETVEALGGCPVVFHLQVEDADAAWAKALAAGATVKMPLKDQFWGDRYGMLRDPFGIYWSIGQTVSKPTPAEVEEAAKAVFAH
ncbi:MAG: VOC family protein [Terracidiphilus sp.]|jgi:PhnB protein